MSIKETITSASQAWDDARKYQCMEAWSYEQWESLFDYMDDLSENIGEDIELDVVAWNCDWAPYDNAVEAADDMLGRDAWLESAGIDEEELPEMDQDDLCHAASLELEASTTVLYCNGTTGLVVVQSF